MLLLSQQTSARLKTKIDNMFTLSHQFIHFTCWHWLLQKQTPPVVKLWKCFIHKMLKGCKFVILCI